MSEILPLLLALSLAAVGMLGMAVAFQWTRSARVALKSRLTLISLRDEFGRMPLAHSIGEELAAYGKSLQEFFLFGKTRRWGVQSSGWQLASIGSAAGVVAILVSTLGFGLHYLAALAIALLFFYAVPRLLCAMQQGRAERDFISLFPDVLDMIIRMLRAGLPVTAAVRAVGSENIPPISKVFAQIADQTDIGIPFEDALNATGKLIGMADFRFFAVAIALQRSTGGNLAATLEILSGIIRQRRAVRLKARAATAEIRVSAIILGALPFLVGSVLILVQPDYIAPLITDYRGNIILALAAGALSLGFLTMRQMLRSVTSIR